MPVPFTSLPSHTPASPVRTSERLDPYYDALWDDGTQASWLSRGRAVRSVRAGIGKLPKHLAGDPGDAWERFEQRHAYEQKLGALAVVDTWRTATCEQVAALTGHHKLATGRHRSTGDLFAQDLIEVGVFADALVPGPQAARGTLFRPARQSASTLRMEEQLTYPEWVSVTAGQGYEFTRQFDRHNLLATELGLRVAEFCRIGTVLGEKLSSVNTIAYEGWGRTPPRSASQQTADLTIVRQDGLRVAVEITASQGASLEAKIERWAETLSRQDTNTAGLVVVFLVAGRQGSSHTTATVMSKTRKAITAAARRYPGHPDDRTVNRMMVADWATWFPSRGHTTKGFLMLAAERPTGDPINPWESVEVLNTDQLVYQPGHDDALAVLGTAAGLRATPHWLRHHDRPELWPVTLYRQGFKEGIPHLTGLTDKGRTRHPFQVPAGAVGAAQPPPSLVY